MNKGTRKERRKNMAPKQKRLTQQEKRERAMVKRELQEAGILPPDKPRLNRKRFKAEVQAAWDSEMNLASLSDALLLSRAITWMLADVPSQPVTPEQIGLLKAMKIALELKRMYQRADGDGPGRFTMKDEYDHIKPVMDL